MLQTRATVLLSGGIDSASCVYLLKQEGFQLAAVFVDFGQASARMERRAAEMICARFNLPLRIISASGGDSLGAGELRGRNAFLVTSALLLGRCYEGLLALGIHAGTPYYDCSPAFLDRIDLLAKECTNGKVSVIAPFLHWSKDDVYSFFLQSQIPLAQTFSCENATSGGPCGICRSCSDRARLECLPNDAA
jgi:7-cyano-7-deazaguanine synthase